MSKKSRLLSRCLIGVLLTSLIITSIVYADESTPLTLNSESGTSTCDHVWEVSRVDETPCIKTTVYTCTKCQATKTEKVQLSEHTWIEDHRKSSTCLKKGTVYYICWDCNATKTKTLPLGKHKWTSYKTVKKATVFKKGLKKGHCKTCKKTKKKYIAKRKAFIKINKKKLTLKVKKSKILTVKFAYGDKVKSWKSSNAKIVSVNKKGKLIAKASGKATITVKLKSGKKAKCKVTVPKVKKAKAKKSSSGSSGGGTVYWTPSGSVWHVSRSCSTLSRSKTVYSGTIAQSGKPRCCKVCG